MKLRLALFSLAISSTASAQQLQLANFLIGGCQVSDNDNINTHANLLAREATPQSPSTAQLPTSIDVNVHFHIASTINDTNLITQSILDAQWSILESAFSPHNINLHLQSTSRLVSDLAGQYFFVDERNPPDSPYPNIVNHEKEREEYLRSTRKGGYDELNIYFFTRYPGQGGYCTFPTVRSDPNESEVLGVDGCALGGLTMPGFSAQDEGEISKGASAVHEAGHWFGLNHTFVGGCNSATGDFVDDTPATTQIFGGCPVGSDSCPDQPGLDPIHNFMSYTSDDCRTEFTAGQQKRMFSTFFGFRRSPP